MSKPFSDRLAGSGEDASMFRARTPEKRSGIVQSSRSGRLGTISKGGARNPRASHRLFSLSQRSP
jgi:hypothetical protein